MQLTTSQGIAVPVQRFEAAQAKQRILWLPNDTMTEQHTTLARQLAEQGMEVWLLRWPSVVNDASQAELTTTLLAETLSLALPREQKDFYIMAFGKGTDATLYALQQWQRLKPDDARQLAGLLLAYPQFSAPKFPLPLKPTPPTYLFQPERSEHHAQLEQLVDYLEDDGQGVYVQHVKDVLDGYLERSERSADEWLQSAIFPAEVQQALTRLRQVNTEPAAVPGAARGAEKALQPYGNIPAPALILEDLDRRQHNLQDYKGKVVVLNFWATWCPPCVKELPALNNLQKRFAQDDLVVLGVDIGESADAVAAFLDRIPVDYPILLDEAGSTPKAWALRAFPTTLIIDQQGIVRMGYEGDLEWDADPVVQTLETAFGIKAVR